MADRADHPGRRTATQLLRRRLGPLGPRWVANCCHEVRAYEEGYAVMAAFVDDPAAYWREHGIAFDRVRFARDNLKKAGVPIPPYIEEALEGE